MLLHFLIPISRIVLYTVLIILPCSNFLFLLLSYVTILHFAAQINGMNEGNRAGMCELMSAWQIVK